MTDPYITFKFGEKLAFKSESKTSFIVDNLNPVWDEDVPLGLLSSAAEVFVEVKDSDIGFEYGDDSLLSAKVRVPFCSTFMAKEQEVKCRPQDWVYPNNIY